MLWADKRALEHRVRVNMLQIRERELQFYSANLQSIGLQAAFLAGFLYPAIIYIVIPEGKDEILVTVYLCVTATAFGLHMLALVNAMMCAMLAPGLALRGPDGAMHRALDDLLQEYRLTFFLFVLGIVAYGVSSVLLCFVLFTWTAALATALVAFYFAVLGYTEFSRVYKRFKLPPRLFITGRFDTDQAAYEASITAADLRGANLRHAAQQTVVESWQQYLNPTQYSRAYLDRKLGPVAQSGPGY